jgi:hypothetical protein
MSFHFRVLLVWMNFCFNAFSILSAQDSYEPVVRPLQIYKSINMIIPKCQICQECYGRGRKGCKSPSFQISASGLIPLSIRFIRCKIILIIKQIHAYFLISKMWVDRWKRKN